MMSIQGARKKAMSIWIGKNIDEVVNLFEDWIKEKGEEYSISNKAIQNFAKRHWAKNMQDKFDRAYYLKEMSGGLGEPTNDNE
tara:strand:- start:24 stop:272 length:249 start_codon:yes stop_codon:yes gene_type:complete